MRRMSLVAVVVSTVLTVAVQGGGVTLDVHSSTGTNYTGPHRWGTALDGEHEAMRYLEGDFTGDGKTDIAAVWHSENGNANINIHVSGGSSFTAQNWLTDNGAISEDLIWLSGDFTGDGYCDIAVVWAGPGGACVDVYPSTGTGFSSPVAWAVNQGGIWDSMIWMSGDYTGDGKCDILKLWNDAGFVTADVHPSNGSAFTGVARFITGQGGISDDMVWMSGDYTGDGNCDIMKLWNNGGAVDADVYASSGSSFSNNVAFARGQGGIWPEMSWMSGDFNGDGYCDISKVFNIGGLATADVHASSGTNFSGIARFADNQGSIWGGMKWFAGNFDGSGADDIAKLWVNFSAPRVVETIYPTEEHTVVDDNVLNYGADDTGVWDATTAIQTAINAVFNSGGGTVWLPAGKYRVTDTLTVRPNVCLQGDWDDPDTDDHIGGTIILADLPSGTNSPALFSIGGGTGCSGVKGITVFYPDQNAAVPLEYNYTFHIPGNWGGLSSVENCTMINSYKGIGVSTDGSVHYCLRLRNIKGTVLHTGFEAYNSSDVGTAENVRFSNEYWANAGTVFNAPWLPTLNAWTRTYGVGFVIGDLEWSQFYNIYCADYAVGIQFVPGSRFYSQCNFFSSTVTNCSTAVQAVTNSIDDRWGTGFTRCALSGTTGVDNQSDGYIRLTDCETSGGTSGTVYIDNRGLSTQDPGMAAIPKGTNSTLYIVTDAPYNAPRTIIGGADTTGYPSPTIDATAAIQSALDAAGAAGGGIVYLPAGWYRIDSHLSVPAHVELRGASSIPFKSEPGASRNTWLFCHEGRNGSIWNTAAVTLNGDGAGVNGIGFFYPGQNPETNGPQTIVSYPATIRADGKSDVYVNNVVFFNAYVGMILNNCPDHFVRNTMGTAFFRFAWLGGAAGQISTVLNNPVYCVENGWDNTSWTDVVYTNTFWNDIIPWTRNNQIMMDFTAVPGENVFNAFSYGTAYLADFYNSSTADFYNVGSDNIGGAGFYVAPTGGTVRANNYARYNGLGSIGNNVYLYNHMAIFEGYMANPTDIEHTGSGAQGGAGDLFQGATVTANSAVYPAGFNINDLFSKGSPVYAEDVVFADADGSTLAYVEFNIASAVNLRRVDIGLANDPVSGGNNDNRALERIKVYAGDTAASVMSNLVADVSIDPEYTTVYGGSQITVSIDVDAFSAQYFRVEFTEANASGVRVMEIDGYGEAP